MASNFDRWEKDPFFTAAEEVQESADRMESTYRTWIHERKDGRDVGYADELRRDLKTTLGTAKWQMEEFERAVKSSYVDSSAEDARTRHNQFIAAISNQILMVENSLKESVLSDGQAEMSWVRLDEGERDELALFLSGSSDDISLTPSSKDDGEAAEMHKESMPEYVKDSCRSAEWGSQESKEEKLHGHRRTASASADISAWKIVDMGENIEGKNERPNKPPPRILSFSGLLNTMEPMTKVKWSIRKWKNVDRHQAADTLPLRSNELSRDFVTYFRYVVFKGIDACYERSKSCLNSCDDSYDKQIYGWLGSVQRQLQRSQYRIQYGRPVQVAFWIFLAFCLIRK
ncbi:hypothetical protein GIB67_030441 [Kingdonia uniflora]|uniref:Syntaxin 6/10/61 N-terminal domain-containing protein n=1 Tax=Kingdonia uniflora TaxID=39325 RepID=A0A7J7NDE0_9MAGN|nr:hypothetical protein GIB67_030441 [Kingdonia uniflora]